MEIDHGACGVRMQIPLQDISRKHLRVIHKNELGRYIQGYLKKKMQIPLAQDRSIKTILIL